MAVPWAEGYGTTLSDLMGLDKGGPWLLWLPLRLGLFIVIEGIPKVKISHEITKDGGGARNSLAGPSHGCFKTSRRRWLGALGLIGVVEHYQTRIFEISV